MTETALDLGPVKPGLLAVLRSAEMNGERTAIVTESTNSVYRRNIVKLTEERNQARVERDKALADWKKEVHILRAQLSEGTAPRVEALTRELNRIRAERDRALALLRKERGQ